MLCVSAVHSKAALLSWIKESLSTETCATCQSQFALSTECVETNACEIVSAPWNSGKEVLKWHKFALCQTTLLVKNQNARGSNWDVECKGRSVRASMAANCYSHHCAAKLCQRFLCSSISVSPVRGRCYNVRNTQFADATFVCLQSSQKIPGEGICATGLCYTKNTCSLASHVASVLFPHWRSRAKIDGLRSMV